MYAFLGFFYAFVSVYLYKMLTTKNVPIKIYVDTDYIDNKQDDWGDFMMEDDCIDEDDYFDDRYNNTYKDNESSEEKLLVNMTIKKENEKVLHNIHDYLKDNLIVELDHTVDSTDKTTTTWSFEYDLDLELDIKQELIDYVNENVLTDNIIIYYNGERIDANTVYCT